MKSLLAHFKRDCELIFHEDELYIMNKYTKQSKYYTLIVLGKYVKIFANYYKYNVAIIHTHTNATVYVLEYLQLPTTFMLFLWYHRVF